MQTRQVALLPTREDVARVGKGRYPTPTFQTGVPADVIHVQMGVQHGVHLLRPHADHGEAFEERVVETVQRGILRHGLVVAGAGVDEDRATGQAQEPGVDAQGEVAGAWIVGAGRQCVTVLGQGVRPKIGEQVLGNDLRQAQF